MLQRLLANKHTSGAALVYIVANGVAKLGAIWFPAYKEQFDATTTLFENLAVAYGLIMAGDSKPTTPTV